MAGKRKATEEDDFARVYATLPARSIQALRDLPSSEAALLLAQLADLLEVRNRNFKNARMSLPYFSSMKWAHVGGQCNLPVTFPSNGRLSLENTFRVPACYLPPSFHEAVFQSAWKTADVYLDLPDQHTEAARSRVLDPYIVSVVSLFHGRIVDRPEEAMPDTADLSGGEVEHQILSIGGVLFLVLTVKHILTTKGRGHAQLFAELLSAYKQNLETGFKTRTDLRVHGLLTDLSRFMFFSFDPVLHEFAFDEEFKASPGYRQDQLQAMIPVTNKIFSVLLSGYISVVEGMPTAGLGQQLEEDDWKKAAAWSIRARELLSQPMPVATLETRATEGLAALTESVVAIPRYEVPNLPQGEPRFGLGVQALAQRQVARWHDGMQTKLKGVMATSS